MPKELLDENGEPKVFYHQTSAEFDTFDIRHKGAGTYDSAVLFGVFLKPTDTNIGLAGNIQMPLFVRMKNPVRFANRYALTSYLRLHVDGYADAADNIKAVNKEYQKKYDDAEQENREYLQKLRASGLTREQLSEEYYKRKDASKAIMEEKEKGNVKKATAASAVIVAHHYEVLADYYKQMGQNVTAKELMAKRIGLGEEESGAGRLYNQQRSVYDYTYEENQQAIKEYFNNTPLEDLPVENMIEESNSLKDKSNEDLVNMAIEKIKELKNKGLKDSLGEEIFFNPGSTEDERQYAIHFTAGKDKAVGDVTPGRMLGVMALEKTLTNPLAIIIQPDIENPNTGETLKGRKLYLAIFQDDRGFCTQVVVGVSPKDKDRIVTVYVSKNKKGHKNNAINEFRNRIASAQNIIYLGRQSEYPRHPIEYGASTVDTNLHPSGDFILPQKFNYVKKNINDNMFFQKKQGKNFNDTVNETYLQRAWHGTGAVFNAWDLGYAGTGEGGSAHGWGLYFAQDKIVYLHKMVLFDFLTYWMYNNNVKTIERRIVERS